MRDRLVAGDPESAGHTCGRRHQGRVGWRVRHFRTITLARGGYSAKQWRRKVFAQNLPAVTTARPVSIHELRDV